MSKLLSFGVNHTGLVSVEWLGPVDWNREKWGIQKHRRGFYLKLGSRGFSVWNPWYKK